jgi:hypothetical protein
MAELNARHRVLLLDELHDPLQRLDESIVPDAKIADRAAAAPLDLGRLDHDQPRAAGGEFSRIHQMPVGRKSLHRRILMHRRHHNAVAQRNVPDLQRRKQQGPGHIIPLAISSRRGLLCLDSGDIRGSLRRQKPESQWI